MVEVVKKSILEVADDVVARSAIPPLMAKLAERAHQTGATLGFTSGVTAPRISSETADNSVYC
jgi:hypothetical protein